MGKKVVYRIFTIADYDRGKPYFKRCMAKAGS